MEKEIEGEKRYKGYFLMDSGIKIYFDILAQECGDDFSELYDNSKFLFERGDCVWLGEKNNSFILVDRIVGFSINEYFAE